VFEEISDRIREEGPHVSFGVQILHWAVVLVVSVVLFGGLYLVVQHME
jgi:hypothetical protein